MQLLLHLLPLLCNYDLLLFAVIIIGTCTVSSYDTPLPPPDLPLSPICGSGIKSLTLVDSTTKILHYPPYGISSFYLDCFSFKVEPLWPWKCSQLSNVSVSIHASPVKFPDLQEIPLTHLVGGSLVAIASHFSYMVYAGITVTAPFGKICPLQLNYSYNVYGDFFPPVTSVDLAYIDHISPFIILKKSSFTLQLLRPYKDGNDNKNDTILITRDHLGCYGDKTGLDPYFLTPIYEGKSDAAATGKERGILRTSIINNGFYYLCMKPFGNRYWFELGIVHIYGGNPAYFKITGGLGVKGNKISLNVPHVIMFYGVGLDLREGADSAKVVNVFYNCAEGKPSGGVAPAKNLGPTDEYGDHVTVAHWNVTFTKAGKYRFCYQLAGSTEWVEVPFYDQLSAHAKFFHENASVAPQPSSSAMPNVTTASPAPTFPQGGPCPQSYQFRISMLSPFSNSPFNNTLVSPYYQGLCSEGGWLMYYVQTNPKYGTLVLQTSGDFVMTFPPAPDPPIHDVFVVEAMCIQPEERLWHCAANVSLVYDVVGESTTAVITTTSSAPMTSMAPPTTMYEAPTTTAVSETTRPDTASSTPTTTSQVTTMEPDTTTNTGQPPSTTVETTPMSPSSTTVELTSSMATSTAPTTQTESVQPPILTITGPPSTIIETATSTIVSTAASGTPVPSASILQLSTTELPSTTITAAVPTTIAALSSIPPGESSTIPASPPPSGTATTSVVPTTMTSPSTEASTAATTSTAHVDTSSVTPTVHSSVSTTDSVASMSPNPTPETTDIIESPTVPPTTAAPCPTVPATFTVGPSALKKPYVTLSLRGSTLPKDFKQTLSTMLCVPENFISVGKVSQQQENSASTTTTSAAKYVVNVAINCDYNICDDEEKTKLLLYLLQDSSTMTSAEQEEMMQPLGITAATQETYNGMAAGSVDDDSGNNKHDELVKKTGIISLAVILTVAIIIVMVVCAILFLRRKKRRQEYMNHFNFVVTPDQMGDRGMPRGERVTHDDDGEEFYDEFNSPVPIARAVELSDIEVVEDSPIEIVEKKPSS